MEDDFDFDFPFEINYERVFKANNILPMVRLLAAELMKNPYMTIGSYLQRARDSDLQTILFC